MIMGDSNNTESADYLRVGPFRVWVRWSSDVPPEVTAELYRAFAILKVRLISRNMSQLDLFGPDHSGESPGDEDLPF